MEIVESMECLKLYENKADKRSRSEYNNFRKTLILLS